jgi:hypothetical protein
VHETKREEEQQLLENEVADITAETLYQSHNVIIIGGGRRAAAGRRKS